MKNSKYASKVRRLNKALNESNAAYDAFFKSALDKYGVASPDELEGDKKKEFFDYVDKNWDATGQVSEDTLAGWIAIFNGKKLEIRKGQDAKDLWGAKEYAIKKLNVPKSKQGLLAVEPAYESIQREDGHSEEDELREMIRRELRKMM